MINDFSWKFTFLPILFNLYIFHLIPLSYSILQHLALFNLQTKPNSDLVAGLSIPIPQIDDLK